MANKKTKKILTIEDLVQFCQMQNFYKFSSAETGYQLSVQVPAVATYKKEEEIKDDTLLFCKVKLFHIGRNRNGSSVTKEAAERSLATIAYKPLLANFCEIDGVKDFTSHDMNILEDGSIEYIERQIGTFTADKPYIEYDEENDKDFVYAYVAIPREYSDASEIIERKEGTKVSVELIINAMSYNAAERMLELEDIIVQGATCLGVNPETGEEVGEGMKGARLDIVDFSVENNSMFSEQANETNQKLIETLEKLNNTLTNFNINDSKESKETYGKEDIEVDEKDIMLNEEVEETEETTEITETEEFEVADEVEEAVEEGFKESTEEEETEAEESETPAEDETPEVVEEDSEEREEFVEESVEEITEETAKEYALVEKNFEIDGKKFSLSFELSHDDIRYGLYNLLGVYEELDNEWYGIRAVYDNYFVMQGWCAGKIYGQKYTVDGDSVALDGERWNLYEELLTDSELAELKEMRSNYASLAQFKLDTENAQLHAQRESILYDEKYSVLAEKDENNEYKNEAYAKLVSEMDNYSLTDLEKELKSVFADYITNGGQFAYVGESEVKPTVSKKLFATSTSKKTSRYGNLFNK